MTRAKDISKILTDADISGNIDVDGVTNLDVVDIDGAVDMASTLQVDGAITSSTGMTITTADNTDQLTLVSTDGDAGEGPNLVFYRNSSSPADGDDLSTIDFIGRNDNSQNVTYGQIKAVLLDASDGTEDARLEFYRMKGGSISPDLQLNSEGVVINEGSNDVDFRVESNGNANMLFVNGGNDAVGIGTNDPQVDLEVRTGVTSRLRVSGAANTNSKVEIGYDNSTGPYIKAGSSGTNKLQVYVDNTSLAAEFRGNGDFYSNDGSVHSLSDSRIKKDIADLTDGLDIVKQLKPRTFKYNGKATTLDDDRTRYGFVADEVMAIASQYVSEETQTIDGVEVDDFKSLSTTKMIPMLVKAIQELEARITTLENA